MNVELLSRLQFALTIGFHFLFPPITIGLAWLLVAVEYNAWRKATLPDGQAWDRAGRFFGKILGLTFAVGVATGIPMEFQFGTNWSRYSKFVGDIFGAPLAAEGVLAFFLESGFLGLYLFGRDRVAKKWHVVSILMVALGSTLSAFWILVANSWMQTPAGFRVFQGRAELTSFTEAVFNPSMWPRFTHTLSACLVCGSFVMLAISAWLVRRNRGDLVALKTLRLSLAVGLVSSILVAFPSGHEHARQVARTQPEKFAAIEGLYTTQTSAPLAIFGYPTDRPPDLKARIEIPGMLSWLAFGDLHAKVRGINEFPEEDRPPLWMTFVSFHNMVILGLYFQFVTLLACVQWYRGKLPTGRRLLTVLVWSAPLPLIACQFGWVTAEVGRQPWIVYGLMRSADAFSSTLTLGEVWASLVMFGLIYVLLGALYLFLLFRKVRHGPGDAGRPLPAVEVSQKGLVTA